MTHTSLRHTKKRSSDSSFDPSSDDGGSGLVSLWNEYESLQHKTGLSKAELMDLLRNNLMTHTSLRHTKKQSGASSFDPTIDGGNSGLLTMWKDSDTLHQNSRLSKNELMNLLKNQMMTHTSLRHTKKRSSSSSFEPATEERNAGLLSVWKDSDSLHHNSRLSKTDLMALLRNQMMTHTSLRHT